MGCGYWSRGHFWGRRDGGWSRKTMKCCVQKSCAVGFSRLQTQNLAKNKTGMTGVSLFLAGVPRVDFFFTVRHTNLQESVSFLHHECTSLSSPPPRRGGGGRCASFSSPSSLPWWRGNTTRVPGLTPCTLLGTRHSLGAHRRTRHAPPRSSSHHHHAPPPRSCAACSLPTMPRGQGHGTSYAYGGIESGDNIYIIGRACASPSRA